MKAIFFFSKLKETEKNKKQLINRMDRIGLESKGITNLNGMESIFFIGIIVSSSSSSSSTFCIVTYQMYCLLYSSLYVNM